MTEKFAALGFRFQSVCIEAVRIAGTDADDLYLHVDIRDDSIFAALFREEGDTVHYYRPTPELFRRLREAWEESAPDKRWQVIECEIADGEIYATCDFPQDLPKGENALDRCCFALCERYRDDKTVLFPPLTAHREKERLRNRRNPTLKERLARTSFILGIILGEAALLTNGKAEDIFVHTVMGDRWKSISVYREEEDLVRCYKSGPEFSDLIQRAWALDDEDQRWSIMEIAILNGRFDAFFLHPGEVDVDNRDIDWREMALRRRFGDKPIVYPPIPDRFRGSTARLKPE